jgi:hypothetical protein
VFRPLAFLPRAAQPAFPPRRRRPRLRGATRSLRRVPVSRRRGSTSPRRPGLLLPRAPRRWTHAAPLPLCHTGAPLWPHRADHGELHPAGALTRGRREARAVASARFCAADRRGSRRRRLEGRTRPPVRRSPLTRGRTRLSSRCCPRPPPDDDGVDAVCSKCDGMLLPVNVAIF